MIYFESLKIYIDRFHNKTITLQIDDNSTTFFSSQNQNINKNLYQFIKERKNWIDGRLFLNNYDYTRFNQSEYLKFINEQIAFCDKDLIINEKWKLKKIFNFIARYYNVNQLEQKKILDLVDSKIQNLKNICFQELDDFIKIKILIILSLLKQNNRFLFINLLEYTTLTSEKIEIIKNICKKINLNFKKEIIIFLNKKYFDNSNVLCLDDKTIEKNNGVFTIGELRYVTQNNSFKNALTMSKCFLKENFGKFLFLFISIACSNFLYLLFFMISDINNEESFLQEIIAFSKNNHIIWELIKYLFVAINMCNTFFWWFFINKKNKKLILFMKNNTNSIIVYSLFIPILFLLFLIMSVFTAICGILGIINFLELNLNNYWYSIPLFLYLIYAIIITIFLGININSKINSINWKQVVIKMIID